MGVNRSALAALPTVKLTFYALLFGLAIYVVRLDFLTGLQAVPSWYLWGNVLALAALPTAVERKPELRLPFFCAVWERAAGSGARKRRTARRRR